MTTKNSAIAKKWWLIKVRKVQAWWSMQSEDKLWITSSWKTIEPPYPFDDLIEIYEIDTTAKRCIDVIAQNVIKWGFNITSDQWESTDQMQANIDTVYNFFMNANPNEPFTKVINDLIVDLKSTWNAALEVSRWFDWKPANFYRIPIYTIRYQRSEPWKFTNGQRYVQNAYSTSGETVYFNRYHAKEENRNESNWYSIDINWPSNKTNEVIRFKLSNPKDKYYGLSQSVTLLKSYLIKKYVDEYNVNEFEAWLLSKFAVVVENWTISDDSITALSEYVQDMIDTKKWSSVPILTVRWQNAKIRIEKLSWDYHEWSYLNLRKDAKQDVMTAFWVPPVILWIVEDANRANSIEQEKAFYEKEILPLQEQFEYIFTQMIKYDFWFADLNFKFTAPNFDDKLIVADITDKWLKNGKYSINEARWMEWLDMIQDEWANERFVQTSLWPINVKDLINLSSADFASAQWQATGKTIVDSLLWVKAKYEASIKRKEIATGTDDPDFKDEPYTEIK